MSGHAGESAKGDEASAPGGAHRTPSFVIRRENQADVGTLAERFVAPGTSISADESDAYELLHGGLPMRRVNHAWEPPPMTARPRTAPSLTSRAFGV